MTEEDRKTAKREALFFTFFGREKNSFRKF